MCSGAACARAQRVHRAERLAVTPAPHHPQRTGPPPAAPRARATQAVIDSPEGSESGLRTSTRLQLHLQLRSRSCLGETECAATRHSLTFPRLKRALLARREKPPSCTGSPAFGNLKLAKAPWPEQSGRISLCVCVLGYPRTWPFLGVGGAPGGVTSAGRCGPPGGLECAQDMNAFGHPSPKAAPTLPGSRRPAASLGPSRCMHI